MADDHFHLAVFAWLLACAVQDWRSREISNWLTLPPLALALCLRLAGVVQGSILPLLIGIVLLLLVWKQGWSGGADAKASLALALLDIHIFAWAWLGLGLWYLGLRLYYGQKCDRRLPAFVGFATGAGALLAVETLR